MTGGAFGVVWSQLATRIVVMLLVIVLDVKLQSTQPWWTDAKSWALLEAQVPGIAVQPLWSLSRTPTVQSVRIDSDEDGPIAADLYIPNSAGRLPGVLLVNGVEPQGRKLPEFAHLAEAFARAGYVVLAPDIPGLVAERIRPADIGAVVASFQRLLSSDKVLTARAGMIGFSIGASLELLAAADPRISGNVAFVDDIGGYARLLDVMQAATTQTVPDDDAGVLTYVPNPYVWIVGRNSLIGMAPNVEDQKILAALFPSNQPDPAPDQSGREDALSPDGRALYDLFVNRDPQRVQEYAARLPDSMRKDLSSLSPDEHTADIRAYVRIVHDRGDPYIPVHESRLLDSSPTLRGHVSLLELSVLQHVELAPPSLDPRELLGFYVPQLVRLNGYVRDTLAFLDGQARD